MRYTIECSNIKLVNPYKPNSNLGTFELIRVVIFRSKIWKNIYEINFTLFNADKRAKDSIRRDVAAGTVLRYKLETVFCNLISSEINTNYRWIEMTGDAKHIIFNQEDSLPESLVKFIKNE